MAPGEVIMVATVQKNSFKHANVPHTLAMLQQQSLFNDLASNYMKLTSFYVNMLMIISLK